MVETTPRYAIYFVPAVESNLYRFGASVLGYDCYSGADLALDGVDATRGIDWPALTEEPRRYGFHATLKAPFFLSPACEEAQLASAVQSFAGLGRAVASFDPEVRRIGEFVAVVPRVRNPELDELAHQCVTIFDAFRAPMTAQERSRRLASGLSQSQLQNLDRWGYPYLFEDFRFHMTLTGKVPAKAREAIVTQLAAGFSRVCGAQPVIVDRLALLKQDGETARFRVISQDVFGPR